MTPPHDTVRDVVVQPRKVECSALWHAVDGRVLINILKELLLDAVQWHSRAFGYQRRYLGDATRVLRSRCLQHHLSLIAATDIRRWRRPCTEFP